MGMSEISLALGQSLKVLSGTGPDTISLLII